MSDHADNGSLETGADMDYSEHEKTYSLFLSITRWTIIVNVALLVALAFGFFTSAGFIASVILFVILTGMLAFFSA